MAGIHTTINSIKLDNSQTNPPSPVPPSGIYHPRSERLVPGAPWTSSPRSELPVLGSLLAVADTYSVGFANFFVPRGGLLHNRNQQKSGLLMRILFSRVPDLRVICHSQPTQRPTHAPKRASARPPRVWAPVFFVTRTTCRRMCSAVLSCPRQGPLRAPAGNNGRPAELLPATPSPSGNKLGRFWRGRASGVSASRDGGELAAPLRQRAHDAPSGRGCCMSRAPDSSRSLQRPIAKICPCLLLLLLLPLQARIQASNLVGRG